MKAITQCAAVAALATALACPSHSLAQDNAWNGGGGAGGNWLDTTWTQGGTPNSSFDARAVIGSTAGSASPTGVVNVTSDIRVSNPSPTIVLGNGAGTHGTLNITATGKMHVQNLPPSAGNVEVGLNGGTGVLNVAGGTLQIDGELRSATSGNAASTISLSGAATVTAASAFLDRRIVVDGGSVNFTVPGNLTLGQGGIHTWRIGAGGPSTLKVGGNADLGGTLKLEFTGSTPTVGSSWNLIDSDTVDFNEATPSSFNNVDQSAVAGLVPGARFTVQSVASPASMNGMFTRVALEQHPVLTVDRATGAMSLRNYGSVPTVEFDAYAITSALGGLNPANWSSIATANNWVEANPSANALSELKTVGSANVPASSSISLGTPYARPAPTAFGQENEDVVFRFAKPGGGFTTGQVIYTGVPNNTLTLNVDPDTGAAQIVNGSSFTVSIDAYVITSGSQSLKFANGTWNSLDDQNTSGGNWQEANPSTSQLSELLTNGGLALAPNARVNIGVPFDGVNGREDLLFRFALTASNPNGDFNVDGVVDGADFLSWQRNLGAASDEPLNGNGDDVAGVSGGDLAVWKARFGSTNSAAAPGFMTGKVLYSPLVTLGASAAAAVPEASTFTLLAMGLSIAAAARRRQFAC